MGTSEVIGIGTVAIAMFSAFTGIMYKISVDNRKSHEQLTNKVIDVIVRNSETSTELRDAVKASTETSERANIAFNELLKQLLNQKR